MTTYPIRWRQASNGYGDDGRPIRQRESFIYITENGAIEGWRTPASDMLHPDRHYGGIEVHSRTPMFEGHEPHPESCQWTRGVCYRDGSSLAFERIEWSFDSPDCIFDELAAWADSHLGNSE